MYMQKKYPNMGKTQQVAENQQGEGATAVTAEGIEKNVSNNETAKLSGDSTGEVKIDAGKSKPIATKETTISIDNKYWKFDLSSKGMGIRNFQLNSYTDRNFEPQKIAEATADTLAFETNISGNLNHLNFDIKKQGENNYVGVANYQALTITKSLEF